MTEISLAYDEATRKATLTFPNGRKLTVGNVSREEAEDFAKRHGPEFQRRDCILHTDGTVLSRSSTHGE